ncbi:MAG TPA: group 1 truncated hemoglobin [Acidimicrobiia bacterium]|nr:group 1 truncated hemoglobin [Acidimicrobiia bacterium]
MQPTKISLVRIVTDFYARVLASADLAPFFDGVPMETLIKHQTAFINAIGRPASHHGDEQLASVHTRLNIAESDFDQLIRLLAETLEWHSYPAEEADVIIAHFEDRRGLVVASG